MTNVFFSMSSGAGGGGSGNAGSGGTGSTLQSPTSNTSIPKVVRSRINLANGRTRFTPLRTNGQPVSAGLNHVISRHFGESNTQSQFTDGEAEVLEKNRFRAIFQIFRELRRVIRRPGAAPKKPPAPSPTTVTISEKDANHIFRKSPGHLPVDTPANRQLLINRASNPKNYLCSDKFGNQWYAEVRPDGTQVWVRVRNGQIINGGVNQTSKTYDPQTGLNKPKL